MKDILLKILYYLGLSIAGIIILLAVGLYLLPFTTPYLQRYHNEIATLASNLIRCPLKISTISADREGVNPEIHLHNVVIYNPEGTHEVAKFADIYVGVSLFKSLINKRIETNLLLISGARLDLYQEQNSTDSKYKIPSQVENILLSLFLTKQISLQNISVVWHAKDGKKIVCPNLQLDIKNRLLEHQLVGIGSLEDTNPSWFKFIFKLYGYDFHSNRTKLTGYVKFVQENKAAFDLWFTWQQQKLQSLQSQFAIHNFTLQPTPRAQKIYIHYLAGNVLLRPEHDFWSLIGDYQNINVNYGNLFRQSLKIDALQSIFSWQHTKRGWKIIASNLTAKNQDLAVNADAQIFIPANQNKPRVDMLADFTINNVAEVKRYYPTQLMPQGLTTWLDDAIVGGKNISGAIVIKHNTRILVNSILHDIQLKFDPDWPAINHITGNMIFDNKSMRINANGKTLNLPMDNIYVKIPNLERPILTARGTIKGDNNDALNYIHTSPLQHTIGAYFGETHIAGPMSLRLKVTVPLSDSPGSIDARGKITEDQGVLQIPSWQINLTNIAGNIYFHDDAVKTAGLKAILFNGPITMDVNTLKSNSKYPITRINGHGRASVDAMKEQIYMPILAQLSGEFNYQARLSLFSDPKRISNFTLMSNLEGVKIDLPPPLTKTEEQLQSLYVNTTFGGREPIYVKLRCGENLSAALKFTKDNQRLKFLNGAVNFGHGIAVIQDQPGLLITGYLPKINWSDWQPYLTTQTTNRQSSIRKVILDLGQLDAYEQDLPNTKLQVIPQAHAWQLYIDSSKINGQLTIPYTFPQQTLVAKFNRLYLTTKSKKFHTLQPNDIPPLHVISNDFRFAGKNYGYLELNVVPKNDSLRINKLAINAPLYNFSTTGEWQIIKGKPNSALYGTLQIKDAGALLQDEYNTNNLVGGNGNATFSLHWQGSIYQPNLSSMQGTVSLYLQQGRIVNLSKATQEKIGLGQMLNILSLQSLPQHLTLNFSDLTKKGYSFNEMRGDYKLAHGDIYIYDTALNGTVARITAQGRIGLIAKDCDLLLTMVPNVTSSLPVLATIVGGPVVGAVTFVGDEIFKHTLQPAMAYKYKVTGLWASPKVVRLNVQNGKQKKP